MFSMPAVLRLRGRGRGGRRGRGELIERGRRSLKGAREVDEPAMTEKSPAFQFYPSDALGRFQGQNILMHRLLTNAPKGTEVDHGNHNGLDNRRSANLKVCGRTGGSA